MFSKKRYVENLESLLNFSYLSMCEVTPLAETELAPLKSPDIIHIWSNH